MGLISCSRRALARHWAVSSQGLKTESRQHFRKNYLTTVHAAGTSSGAEEGMPRAPGPVHSHTGEGNCSRSVMAQLQFRPGHKPQLSQL